MHEKTSLESCLKRQLQIVQRNYKLTLHKYKGTLHEHRHNPRYRGSDSRVRIEISYSMRSSEILPQGHDSHQNKTDQSYHMKKKETEPQKEEHKVTSHKKICNVKL